MIIGIYVNCVNCGATCIIIVKSMADYLMLSGIKPKFKAFNFQIFKNPQVNVSSNGISKVYLHLKTQCSRD